MPEKERKKKGLSFSARPEEKQPPDESSLVRELLNECCEITDAAPISDDNRGSGATFVSQFGFGFFSIDANTVFTDEDQQIFDQVNQERDAESVAEMRHDDKDSITALDYEDMPNGMMDNAEKVEAYNIPVAMVDETEANEMTLAMDNDSLPDEDVEEYNDPYYAEQMENQGSTRSTPARTDNHKDMIKRGHKQQLKRRTVCMRQERQEHTDRVEMRDVFEDPRQSEELDCVIMVDSKVPLIKAEKMDTAEAVETHITPIEIKTEEHDQIVMARIASRTVIDEATEEMSVCLDILLEELITEGVVDAMIDAEENSWIEVPLRPAGEAQKERTGLLPQDGSEIFNNYYAPFIQEHEVSQIEITDEIAKHKLAMDGRDAMGRFIVQDGLWRMTPKPKLTSKEKRQLARMTMLNRKDDGQAVGMGKTEAQKRYDKEKSAAKVTDKARAKAIMDDNRQARKRAKRRFLLGLPPTRRKAISEE